MRSVIVRLPEEEYEHLKTVAAVRKRNVTAAIQMCVSWMASNFDASGWDDVLAAPSDRREPSPQPAAPAPVPLLPGLEEGAESGAAPGPDVMVVDDYYPYDRRSCRRYSVRMRVTGRVEGDTATRISGTALNLSSSGLLLVTQDPIESDAPVRLCVEWPLRSYRGKPLWLWSRGNVVWRSGTMVGLRTATWEFCEVSLAV